MTKIAIPIGSHIQHQLLRDNDIRTFDLPGATEILQLQMPHNKLTEFYIPAGSKFFLMYLNDNYLKKILFQGSMNTLPKLYLGVNKLSGVTIPVAPMLTH